MGGRPTRAKDTLSSALSKSPWRSGICKVHAEERGARYGMEGINISKVEASG